MRFTQLYKLENIIEEGETFDLIAWLPISDSMTKSSNKLLLEALSNRVNNLKLQDVPLNNIIATLLKMLNVILEERNKNKEYPLIQQELQSIRKKYYDSLKTMERLEVKFYSEGEYSLVNNKDSLEDKIASLGLNKNSGGNIILFEKEDFQGDIAIITNQLLSTKISPIYPYERVRNDKIIVGNGFEDTTLYMYNKLILNLVYTFNSTSYAQKKLQNFDSFEIDIFLRHI